MIRQLAVRHRLAAFAITTTLVLAGALVTTVAHAQEPTPHPTPYGLVTLPVTITVSGPAQAYAGGQVTFTIDYAFSAPDPRRNQYNVGFTHVLDPATHYVSSDVLSGVGECTLFEQQPLGRDWLECEVGSDAARSGRLAVTLDIDLEFVGPFSYGVYMRGTSIRFEPGSVATFTTEVVAGSEEPQVQISPTFGACGSAIDVTGTGFPPSADMIVVAIPDIAIGLEFEEPAATTDAVGAFHTTITAPDDPAACPGEHGSEWIVFACVPPDCDPKASAPFTLTAELPDTGSGFSDSSGHSLPLILSVVGLAALGVATLTLVRRRRTE